MRYVYGCQNKEHPRVEVVHGMTEIVSLRCQVCGKEMHRIPQVFRWGFSSASLALDKLVNYRRKANV